jgi:hypothetical protein
MNWKKTITRLDFWRKQDEKHQKALNDYCKVIAPNEYAPFVLGDCVNSFMDGLGVSDEIKDWLEYYLYEASRMKVAEVKDQFGDRYDFCKKSDVVKFFNNNYK